MKIVVFSAPEDEAPGLVRTLVEERLVACGNVFGPVRSIYRWEQRVLDETEAVVLMETWEDRAQTAVRRLGELHSYEVPKILVLDPESVPSSYAKWVELVTR